MAGSAEGVSGKSRQQLRHAQIPRSSAGPGAAAGAGDREDCRAVTPFASFAAFLCDLGG